nr:right-handed parallel beta-helix repeat-containing protein [Candidatus Sigynarchaeota archaeon]
MGIKVIPFVFIALFITGFGASRDKHHDHDENERDTFFFGQDDAQGYQESAYYTNFTYIHVNDNWSDFTQHDWCWGNGSESNPYVLENMTIDASGGTGIFVENSIGQFFILRNILVHGNIMLNNCTDGFLDNITCTASEMDGFLFFNSDRVLLVDCMAESNGNATTGLGSGFSLENVMEFEFCRCVARGNQETGVRIFNSSVLLFNETSATGTINGSGFYIALTDQVILFNSEGVDNADCGVKLDDVQFGFSSLSLFKNNTCGANISSSAGVSFFANLFLSNDINAINDDLGIEWNVSICGNYWDDYLGIDSDFDMIGDIAYTGIAGGAGAIDRLPIAREFYTGSRVVVDDESWNAWMLVSKFPWCTGNGSTWSPYTISGLVMDLNGTGPGIMINNSRSVQ